MAEFSQNGIVEIRDLLAGQATVCGPELTIMEAAHTMESEGIGSLGVVDDGRLVGIFTERDLVRAVADGVDVKLVAVSVYMTPDPDDLSPDVEPKEAARWMLATGYRHLPVIENGNLLGMISMKDLMWALVGD